jgi:hypothetical protein
MFGDFHHWLTRTVEVRSLETSDAKLLSQGIVFIVYLMRPSLCRCFFDTFLSLFIPRWNPSIFSGSGYGPVYERRNSDSLANDSPFQR